ncbi:sialic acid-binding Ig-like lectin 8 isoform X2 [Hyperolius riggenbachi]
MRLPRGIVWMQLVAIILLLPPTSGTDCNENNGYSIEVNRAVTIQAGLCVTIPCKFTVNTGATLTNSVGIWGRSGCPDQSLKSKVNIHITENLSNRDCTVTITDAKKEDAGAYHFRFVDTNDGQWNFSYCNCVIKVTVIDLQAEPEIKINGSLVVNEELTLTCVPPGNCNGTSPAIRWIKGDHDGTWKNSSQIQFTPLKADNLTSITCIVTYPAAGSATNKTLILSLLHPPSDGSASALNMVIGIVCGTAVLIIIIILIVVKLYSRRKMAKPDADSRQALPPAEETPQTDFRRLNAQVPKPRLQTKREDFHTDSSELQYAEIHFSKGVNKISPSETEIEYSEIKFH